VASELLSGRNLVKQGEYNFQGRERKKIGFLGRAKTKKKRFGGANPGVRRRLGSTLKESLGSAGARVVGLVARKGQGKSKRWKNWEF